MESSSPNARWSTGRWDRSSVARCVAASTLCWRHPSNGSHATPRPQRRTRLSRVINTRRLADLDRPEIDGTMGAPRSSLLPPEDDCLFGGVVTVACVEEQLHLMTWAP